MGAASALLLALDADALAATEDEEEGVALLEWTTELLEDEDGVTLEDECTSLLDSMCSSDLLEGSGFGSGFSLVVSGGGGVQVVVGSGGGGGVHVVVGLGLGVGLGGAGGGVGVGLGGSGAGAAGPSSLNHHLPLSTPTSSDAKWSNKPREKSRPPWGQPGHYGRKCFIMM